MTDEHERLQADLAAYATGALDRADQAPLEAHLRDCPECPALLAEYRSVVDLLPRSLARATPPPRVRETLLARAGGERAPRVEPRTHPRPIQLAPADRGRGIGFWDRLAGLFNVLRWAAAAALVAGGIAVWSLQQGAGPHPSAGTALLARGPGGRIVPLAGTGAPGAGAQLYVLPDRQRAELVITGLPPLPADRTYQLWFARPGQPTITGGAFRVDSLGQAAAPVIVPAPLEQVSQIAVTEEPSPGSTAPTGQHLLDWLP